jgi:Sec-independent protein translocase protein TatA
MTQKDNILQELSELKSNLINLNRQNIYSVPDGYFEGLAENMLKRVKAEEIANVADELSNLSPLLSSLSREMPYCVPSGYFETLSDSVLKTITTNDLSAKDELAAISPLLSSLQKENLFSVPEGYFENLAQVKQKENIKPATKVVSLTSRTWFRFAAAAVVTGIIILAGLLFFNTEKEPGGKALAKFTRDVKKMDEQQKNDIIDFFDAGLDGKETAQVNPDAKKSKEVKELLEGISDEELRDFQEQTEAIEEVLMTN